MTTVLVTGGNGQVGRSIRDLAHAAQFGHLSVAIGGRDFCDITDPASVTAAFEAARPDVVINAGAYTAVDAAQADAASAQLLNADAVRTLADECATQSVRLIQLSTDYVFDGTKDGWYVESDPTSPLGVYGYTKAAGESAARSHDDHLILRTSWIYSVHGQNFVKTMIRLGSERERMQVVADQFGCPTSAHDLAEALLKLVDHEISGTFHLAGADDTNWYDFAARVMTEAGLDVEVERITTDQYPTPAPRPANSRLDSSALAATTGVSLPGFATSLRPVVAALMASDAQRSAP